jgi:hypothetical protein
MKDMQARMDTIRVFEDLARNKEAFAKHLGPIKGRLNWLERKVGLDNSEASTLRGDIGVVVNLFSKESTGQARGMPELGWIKEQMPAATDKPETFEAFIDRWIARLKEQYNRRKKSLALRNFDVEPIEDFPEIGGSAETQAVAPGKALYTVTGDTGEPEEQELSPEDIEKLKQYDPSLRFERH